MGIPWSWSQRNTLSGMLATCLTIAGLVTGCSATAARPNEQPTPLLAEVRQTEVAALHPAQSDEPPPPQEATELVLWVPDFLMPDTNQNAGVVLKQAFAQLEQRHPALELRVLPKAETGQAGLLTYLRTAYRAAPDVLPDAVILDTQDLWQAADLKLIQPVDATEFEGLDDFFPFTLDAVHYNGQIYGFPYVADIDHLVYYRSQVPAAPATWEDLFALQQRYLFPAGGLDGFSNDFILFQYVAAGGQLTADGQLTNPEALKSVFQFLAQGRQNGTIPATVLNLANANTVWSIFASRSVSLADTPSSFYLSQQETLDGAGFAYPPTRTGEPAVIGHVWACAIVSPEPQQRQLVLELMHLLYDPSVQGQWSRFAHRLPSRRSALETWEDGNPYYSFLKQALSIAQALPNGRGFAEFSRRLQQTQRRVLSGELTPEEAIMELQATP